VSKYIPAFPGQPKGKDGLPVDQFNDGMTLRDYFAGHALAGLMGNSEYERLRQTIDGKVSQDAQHSAMAEMVYQLADAMIKEREKQ
jgi:hypothetical protein